MNDDAGTSPAYEARRWAMRKCRRQSDIMYGEFAVVAQLVLLCLCLQSPVVWDRLIGPRVRYAVTGEMTCATTDVSVCYAVIR